MSRLKEAESFEKNEFDEDEDDEVIGGPTVHTLDGQVLDEKPALAPPPPQENEQVEQSTEETAPVFKRVADENIILDPEQRPESLVKIFKYIDDNENRFVQNLREAVGIQSISSWPTARIECYRMVQFAADRLKDLGFELELRKVGSKPLKGADEVALPPVILGTRGNDPKKKTVLIYGHLDVQPAERSDGWYCEPFYLTEEGNCLYGRGSSDDKGPVMGWFHAIEAYVKNSIRLPVNLKILLESMEECGSDGLDKLLLQQKDAFLTNVDVVVMSDNFWLGKTKPCLTYGLRGLCYFFCEVECGTKDLHSGVYGGTVYEAMPDLIWLMSQLSAADGTILIPGILDKVCPMLPEEEELYKNIDFDLEEYQQDAGFRALRFPGNKTATLMNRWRFPSLTIHGIQGAFDRPGARVVIPRKVIGKFSIRLVPNQDPESIEQLIYMADEGLKPWCANPFHPSFKAARQAIGWTYSQIPDMIREGGSVDKLMSFQESTGKNIVLLPMGASDDRAHAPNEKINKTNYIQGTKVFAAFLQEIGKLEKADL
ncbi:Cytosolic non-specific dipeptidase [Folsomia candida]|uniref:Cytosolic non-specific dipeptidase n=1 Tax=Folsomia candida TaxID=158441 RepID=A0A226ESD4_FOLCA|nr:Cytosolic non-specific dipeptidase [Folsomia candida]